MGAEWRRIVSKLDEVFEDKESLARVIYYLGEESKNYEQTDQLGPAMKILESAMDMAELFKEYAKRLSEDTKKAETDKRFRRLLGLIYAQMLDAKGEIQNHDDSIAVPPIVKLQQLGFEGSIGLVQALSIIPYESQMSMIAMMSEIIPDNIVSTMSKISGTVNKVGGTLVTVTLASIQLTYDAYISIKRWWNGEISGERCCKNIIDSLAAIGGNIGGGFAGMAAGACLGPFGILAGGVMGGILGGEAARGLSDWLTRSIFDIPKSEALENAFKYFGLKQDASNHAINTAYRQKCLEHHPDKGGSSEKFHNVQIHMGVIKAAKGELYD